MCAYIYVRVLYCYTVGITYALLCLDLDSEEDDAADSGGAKQNTSKIQSELFRIRLSYPVYQRSSCTSATTFTNQ